MENLNSISNPEADLEKTIAYEIGYEQNLFDQFLIRVTGYYKDISNESRDITYDSRWSSEIIQNLNRFNIEILEVLNLK